MMQALFRTWTVALVFSALVAFVAPHSFAQTTSKGSKHQEVTWRQVLLCECSPEVLSQSKIPPEANGVLKTQPDYSNSEQTTTEAQTRMAHQEKQLIWLPNLKPMLLEEMNSSAKAGRKILSGAKLIPDGMVLLMMKEEKALSRAEKITREGHGTLERGQKIVMTPRL